MKKYSNKHLEAVCPVWVWAVEDHIKNVGDVGCPMDKYEPGFGGATCCDEFLLHSAALCPWIAFGSYEKAKKEILNLIRQWKAWAGVEED